MVCVLLHVGGQPPVNESKHNGHPVHAGPRHVGGATTRCTQARQCHGKRVRPCDAPPTSLLARSPPIPPAGTSKAKTCCSRRAARQGVRRGDRSAAQRDVRAWDGGTHGGGGGLLQPAFPPCLPRRSRRGGCMAGVGDRQASCLAGSAQGGMCCRGPGAVVEHRDQGACCWSAMHACRYLSAGSSNFGGTLAWAAPEMLLAAPCTHKASGVCVSAAAAAAARCPRRPPAARQLPLVPRPSRGAATSSFDKGRATARRMLATDAGPPLCLSTPSQ